MLLFFFSLLHLIFICCKITAGIRTWRILTVLYVNIKFRKLLTSQSQSQQRTAIQSDGTNNNILSRPNFCVGIREKNAMERTELLRIGSFTMQPALTKNKTKKKIFEKNEIFERMWNILNYTFLSWKISCWYLSLPKTVQLWMSYIFFPFSPVNPFTEKSLKTFLQYTHTHTKHINRWKKFPNGRKKAAIVFVIRRKLSSIWNQLNNNV